MRCECNTHPPSPTYLFFCRKLREYSACSYWSTAERCDNRQRTSIGRHAERTGNLLLFVDRRIIEGYQRVLYPVNRAYTCQFFSFSYSLLGNEPISGSHFSSFLHILPLKQYNGWKFQRKAWKDKLFYSKCLWITRIASGESIWGSWSKKDILLKNQRI